MRVVREIESASEKALRNPSPVTSSRRWSKVRVGGCEYCCYDRWLLTKNLSEISVTIDAEILMTIGDDWSNSVKVTID